MFSLSWDEAATAEVPEPLATALCQTTTADWPHTFVVPKYATMDEYKHYPPANHFHMIQGLSPARLEYWMDLNNVLSQANWAARPAFIEGVDRPLAAALPGERRGEQREADVGEETVDKRRGARTQTRHRAPHITWDVSTYIRPVPTGDLDVQQST